MKVRKLDADGEPAFGRGRLDYLENSPEMVAQNVMTRLELRTGEWFLDIYDGTPYAEQILGEHKKDLYDMAIRKRIIETPGVNQIESYASQLNQDTRRLAVQATIETEFGVTTINSTL